MAYSIDRAVHGQLPFRKFTKSRVLPDNQLFDLSFVELVALSGLQQNIISANRRNRFDRRTERRPEFAIDHIQGSSESLLGSRVGHEVEDVCVLSEEGQHDLGRMVSLAQLEIFVVGKNEEIHEWEFEAVRF